MKHESGEGEMESHDMRMQQASFMCLEPNVSARMEMYKLYPEKCACDRRCVYTERGTVTCAN